MKKDRSKWQVVMWGRSALVLPVTNEPVFGKVKYVGYQAACDQLSKTLNRVKKVKRKIRRHVEEEK
jgi:hypothetical protein